MLCVRSDSMTSPGTMKARGDALRLGALRLSAAPDDEVQGVDNTIASAIDALHSVRLCATDLEW